MLERKPINGGSDPASPDHALNQNPMWTPPPRSPTPAPAVATLSPAQASAIRRGAARWGGERGGPKEARIWGRPPLGSRSDANCGALPHRCRLCSYGCGFQWCGHRHRHRARARTEAVDASRGEGRDVVRGRRGRCWRRRGRLVKCESGSGGEGSEVREASRCEGSGVRHETEPGLQRMANSAISRKPPKPLDLGLLKA